MIELLSGLYFAGLIMLGVAIGSYANVAQYGFMIIGGGTVLYTGAMGIVTYLKTE